MTSPTSDPRSFDWQKDLRAAAHAAADCAAVETLALFRAPSLQVDTKGSGGFDPVTQADRAAEQAMRAAILALRPGDGILGEEAAETLGTSGYRWVLDPIDGTRAYMSGTPTWGTLIAVGEMRDGKGRAPLYGIIDQPYIGERFEGGFGRATLSGPRGTRALRVKGSAPLSEAIIFTTFPEVGTQEEAAGFAAVANQCKLTRYGMDCYAYGLLAAGHIDLVIEAGLQPYDIQGPQAVVEAAGGIVTSWSGGVAHNGGQIIAAAGPAQHDAALHLLAGFAND